MKFKSVEPVATYYVETEDGVYYRTNYNGTVWERMYGESWESVYLDEEDQCKQAWNDLKGRVNNV